MNDELIWYGAYIFRQYTNPFVLALNKQLFMILRSKQ